MPQSQRSKISRNSLCPCNSGVKYKKCHGRLSDPNFIQSSEIKQKEEKLLEVQRKLLQGLGKPIISTKHNNLRTVVVGKAIHQGNWETFHDFLFQYLKTVTGSDWGNNELAKPIEKRHPILKIYDKVCTQQKTVTKKVSDVYSIPLMGAQASFLWLSYNLYLIAHNAELQEKLIARLKHADQFAGANYETYVAAIFLKAGFKLEFENEEDHKTSHCEFTATHISTGKKYSVEAKFRHRKNIISSQGSDDFKLGIVKPLNRALKKIAKHPRIIFIDLDLPTSEIIKHSKENLIDIIKEAEKNFINSNPAPPAYIFITNYPYHYDLDSEEHKALFFTEGFNIPDYGNKQTTLHEAIAARKRHLPLHDLWSSIKTHTTIPSTFDGTLPEFTFGKINDRLKVGNKYIVSNQTGKEEIIEFLQAVVDEHNKKANGLCRNQDGTISIITFPMSDDEIKAYKQSPDTFFGVYQEQCKQIKNPIELFDFFMKAYQSLSKNELLERLKNHPDHVSLKHKNREELLEIYCENLAANHYHYKS